MGGDAGRELSGGRLRCMLANAIGWLWQDRSGGYGIAFTVALVPIFGALAIAVDFSEMNRQRQATLNALDAAGIATARQIVTGVTDDELRAYAKDFFEANLSDVDPTKGTAEQKAMTKAQIDGLTNCASMSRFRNEKLFWNTDGGDLDETFKKIADELSNLRIVS